MQKAGKSGTRRENAADKADRIAAEAKAVVARELSATREKTRRLKALREGKEETVVAKESVAKRGKRRT